eukprot:5696496-Karenia_brevis.AAC.1
MVLQVTGVLFWIGNWQAGQLAAGGKASVWQQNQHWAQATCAKNLHVQVGPVIGVHDVHYAQTLCMGQLPGSNTLPQPGISIVRGHRT